MGKQQVRGKDDSLATAAVRGGGIVVVSRILAQIVQNASMMILARLLIPADFGVVAMAAAILGIVIILNDLGFIDASIQTESLSEHQVSNLFWINVLFAVAIFAVLSASSMSIARLYRDSRVTAIVIVMSLEFIFLALGNQHFGLMKREMLFGRTSLIDLVSVVLGNAFSILSALLGAGYWALVIRVVSRTAIRAVGAWLSFRWRPKRMREVKSSMRLVWFGFRTSATLLFRNLNTYLTQVLLGRSFGASELAYYERSQSLMMMPVSQLSESFYHVAVSTLRRAKEDMETFRKYYLKAVSTLAFVALPFGTIVAVLSPDLIRVVLGPGWEKAGLLLRVFSLTIGLRVLYSTRDWLQVALGRATPRLLWDIGATSATLAAVLIALHFSLNSVVWVVTIAPAVLVLPGLAYAGKPAGLTVGHVLSVCWRLLMAAAGAGWLLWIILPRLAPQWSSILRALAGIPLGGSLYIAIVVLLHGGTRPVREFIMVAGRMRRRS